MRYRIMLHVDVNARDDNDAKFQAKKLDELIKHPMVKMSLESDGIKPLDSLVYKPQPV